MELTPLASSLVSQYQLQEINRSRNNEEDNHNSLLKDKHKPISTNNSSPTQSLAVRNYVSSLQSNQHDHQQSHLHQHDQHQIRGNHGTNPTNDGTESSGMQQESSKFFMSSLLNLSSAPNGHPSSQPTLAFPGQGN